MRIGKWVRVYGDRLPIPQRMSMAFGLFENSELHLVPLIDHGNRQKHECELMISPVPIRSWRSVCRLSVRLRDLPGALAVATQFLKEQRINILLSECCSTYQERAHFDAICDLGQMKEYGELAGIPREEFELRMRDFLERLTGRFDEFARNHPKRDLLMYETPEYVRFSALTGLNDASFVCRRDNAQIAHHSGGALQFPNALARFISDACDLVPPALPHYAMVTGNTEQRYMRVLLIRDHRHMFRLVVDNDLPDYAGTGVGVLHQFLCVLPADVNLMRATNYIFENKASVERGRIDIVGQWDVEERRLPGEAIEACVTREFQALLQSLVIFDLEGKPHPSALKFVKAKTAKSTYPKVYISYSTDHDEERLASLMSALNDNNYSPVLGTDQEDESDEWLVNQRPVGSDVMREALPLIDDCIALISLQTKREDYKVVSSDGKLKYVVPPWLTAEEMYAWSSPSHPVVLRLREAGMDESTFNRNIWTKTFEADQPKSYGDAVRAVINRLNEFVSSHRFDRTRDATTEKQFRRAFAPAEP